MFCWPIAFRKSQKSVCAGDAQLTASELPFVILDTVVADPHRLREDNTLAVHRGTGGRKRAEGVGIPGPDRRWF
jgi:hypothetical protein